MLSPRLLLTALTLAYAAALLPAQTSNLPAELATVFEPVPGNLSGISVGADGSVWGVNAADQIFAWNAQTASWVYIPGALSQIAVGSSSAVFGINSAGQMYRWIPGSEWFSGSWQLAPVLPVTTIGLQPSGHLVQLSVGVDGAAWAIDHQGNLFQSDPAVQLRLVTPYPNAAILSRVRAGFDGAVWTLGNNGVGRIIPPGNQLVVPSPYVAVPTDICVGGDGDTWSYDNGRVYHYNRLTTNWDAIANPGFGRMAVGSATNVWGLDSAGTPYHFDNATQTWVAASGASLYQISAGQNGAVWGLDAAGNIYRGVTTNAPTGQFHLVTGTVSQLSVAGDGNVWAVDPSSRILTYNPLTQDWTAIPGALTDRKSVV